MDYLFVGSLGILLPHQHPALQLLCPLLFDILVLWALLQLLACTACAGGPKLWFLSE